MTLPRHACSRSGVGLLVLGAWLLAAPSPAQEGTAAVPAPSLRWVPADAGTYNVMLRNREQLEAIRQSKAWARLWSLPAVKMGWQMVTAEWAKSDGKLAPVRSWYEQPGNAELVRFAGELFEEEVFSYGSKNSADLIVLAQELQTANQFAPLMAMLKHGPAAANQPAMRIKALLQVLAGNEQRLKFPDMVTGFKLSRTKPAQIAKWMSNLDKTLAQVAPPLAERLKTVKVQGADVYTLVLDGEMIPWDMINLGQFEDQAGDFDKLVKRLKEMKLTIAVTVRGPYLLVSLGEGMAGLEAISDKFSNRLSGRAELAPLAKFADRKLTSISYSSKDYAAAFAGGNQGDHLTASLGGMVKESGLPNDKQAKIMTDVKNLAADLKRLPKTQPGASLSFSFLGKRGTEDYTYNWSKNPGLDGSKPLTLLTHVGNQPLAFAVARSHGSPDDYKLLVRIIKTAHQYFEELALPQFPENAKQAYETFMEDARPLFARLDNATGKLFLPSLDGQVGIVFDAKLKSQQWHKMLPMSARELPFPEIGLILGVQDAPKLRQAFQEYRAIYNGLVDAVAKLAPGAFPDIKLPEPLATKQKRGTIYWYRLPPELGLDPRLGPAGGVSARVAVFTMSPYTTQRLLTTTSWKGKSGPLANLDRPLISAAYFDWAGVVDAISPWVEFALTQSKQGSDVMEQVSSVIEILKVLRSHASATYLENGVIVTHGETVVRDLER